ncbi:2-amino-4-hydroxy-6-hydroxymethyldihydropteridine diphosphokinase [Chengkuizengella axinellae]|uniref:2-amino-4-hydroxy-6-hydroxymethyldihydropteridine diphosphokinase n=1 Tax=Chengkuizengella axinellae TaxID=3064388 RepID=A0ABT9J7J6_9BACL|nr:2-amino-4-hydroxy-6-hydroxymethyldihydropteridine diphosphokinase [Chengkuizengella sp. 2205SS18-9]MDP5276975.1 2-amino-4-hydroxy-6-hydroxymethyldihydropteridine diphosphokinase [Chengkuizengella sp. 2205SS18-9]
MIENIKKSIAYIGLGSNIGERESYLKNAVELLNHSNTKVKSCSNIYETDPVGYTDQDAFLNMVVEIETTYSPEALLHQLAEIEKSLLRQREIHWGPRTIDLDLLLFEDIQLNTDKLIIPHPRMNERLFVLIPLLDVIQDEKRESIQSRVARLLEVEGQEEGVRIWKRTEWLSELELLEN